MTGLLDRGYRPWPLRKVIECHQQGKPVPPRVFVVTFDDGYANNLTEALPILRELRVPATLFVATAYLDSDRPFPNDDWPATGSPAVPRDSWRPLTTAEALELQASGWMELGCHTHTHADFRDRPEALREDLALSLGVLRNTFGIERPTFAFPYGTKRAGFTSGKLVEVVREAGLLCSLTTESDMVPIASSPFDWGRFTAAQMDSPGTLAAKLEGCYSYLRRLLVLHARSAGTCMLSTCQAHTPDFLLEDLSALPLPY